jgi:CRISPR/Cas system-associated exonuclease Cas4 (RecB family)
METFLERLAEYQIQNHLTEINEFCFVFPSRRSCLFFTRYLGQKTPHPLWAPKVITINEFFHEQHAVPISDNISLLFRLHIVYQKVMGSTITIDEFLPLGEMFLGDFNDIDKYLASPQQVFSNLVAIKALDDDYSHLTTEQIEAIQSFWSSFNPSQLSEQQQSFLAVWEKLFELYSSFRNELKADGEAYEGMIFREVAERVRSERMVDVPYKKVVFAGFNALTGCEKVLFHFLNLQNRASFFWDYPQWITEGAFAAGGGVLRAGHEAARFITSNVSDFPSPRDWKPFFNDEFPVIHIASASNELVQARIAHDFLHEVAEEGAHEQTALVLADEQQLLPVLHSIPPEYGAINITLGFPLKNTPAYALIENLLAMQKTTRRTQEGKTWYYHRNVMAVLRHQYMGVLLDEKSGQLVQELIGSKQLFIEGSQLMGSDLLKAVFQKIDTTADLEKYLNHLLILIFRKLKERDDTQIEREFIYYLHTVVNRLSDMLARQTQKPSPETWLSLFRGIALQQSVPFKGEPLSGLQVMGILESRALDFKNLVITGLNEGTFPRTSPPNSFIPYNLRKGHGLPTLENQDAIFAYYFYRLIHRAEKVKLVYTTTKSATEDGEMSRFLQQLYYEYPGEVIMETILQKVSIPTILAVVASKNHSVKEIMQKWVMPGGVNLSPSAISMYLECPMRFYYRYVAGIKEPDEIAEDMDPRLFGNLFHEAVELLYTPFINTTVNEGDIERLLSNRQIIKDTLNTVFVKNIPFIGQKTKLFNDLQGKNSLVYEILYKYIVRFLECEKSITPFRLLALEEKVESQLTLTSGLKVNIGGTIDRTDEKEGILRIIDYKTGKASRQISELEHLFMPEKHGDVKAVFQTLLYALVKSNSVKDQTIAPGVISLKELYKDEYSTEIRIKNKTINEAITLDLVKDEFISRLDAALSELFDENIPFMQTPHRKSCENCIYKENCLIQE